MNIVSVEHKVVAESIKKLDDTSLFLVGKYGYELVDLDNLSLYDGSVMDKFWSYGAIDLHNRKLEVFPAEKVKNLETLEYLNLSETRIEEFPEALRVCKQLRYLNLYSTKITSIPAWLHELENLNYLNITSIPIKDPIPFLGLKIQFPKTIQ